MSWKSVLHVIIIVKFLIALKATFNGTDNIQAPKNMAYGKTSKMFVETGYKLIQIID